MYNGIMQNNLEKVGLNKNEALIYEALLEHGELSPLEIAKHTNLTRENSYNIANYLITKGLVEIVPNKKKIVYRPLPPNKLKELLEEQKQDISVKQKSLDTFLPMLSNLYSLSSKKPSVSFFEGIEGIKKVYEGLFLSEPDEVLVFRSINDDKALGEYLLNHITKMTKLGFKSKVLAPTGYPLATEIKGKKLFRKIRYIDKKEFSLPIEISIYKNKVTFISLSEFKIAVIIESKDFSQTFRTLFEYIWNKSVD